MECSLCGDECENVSHALWECFAYIRIRATCSFMKKLLMLLEEHHEDFQSLEIVEELSYMLGSELWEKKFDGLLSLVKEYIVDMWGIQKHKLYDSDSGFSYNSILSLHLGRGIVVSLSQNGKFGQNGQVHFYVCVWSMAVKLWQQYKYYYYFYYYYYYDHYYYF